MREIEIKAKVRDLSTLIKAFGRSGIEMPDSIVQHDIIFVPKPYKLSEIKKGQAPILRIRTVKDKCTLNLKRDITDQLDCLEYETEITNKESAISILNELSYHIAIEVKKERKQFFYLQYNICIDTVERLGSFIEIEYVADDDPDVEKIRTAMWCVLNEFGVSSDDKVTKGYDRLLDEL
jgi:adenylate cyclase class 2